MTSHCCLTLCFHSNPTIYFLTRCWFVGYCVWFVEETVNTSFPVAQTETTMSSLSTSVLSKSSKKCKSEEIVSTRSTNPQFPAGLLCTETKPRSACVCALIGYCFNFFAHRKLNGNIKSSLRITVLSVVRNCLHIENIIINVL